MFGGCLGRLNGSLKDDPCSNRQPGVGVGSGFVGWLTVESTGGDNVVGVVNMHTDNLDQIGVGGGKRKDGHGSILHK